MPDDGAEISASGSEKIAQAENEPVEPDEEESDPIKASKKEPENTDAFFDPLLTCGDDEDAWEGDFHHIGNRGGKGRFYYFHEVIALLTVVHKTGVWPESVKLAMRRYYKREYPEFFMRGKRAEDARATRQRKAAELKSENRPSRSKIKRVQSRRPEPIDIQTRRRTDA